jgi:hypothetical protein
LPTRSNKLELRSVSASRTDQEFADTFAQIYDAFSASPDTKPQERNAPPHFKGEAPLRQGIEKRKSEVLNKIPQAL